jgi:multidrug efflux pump subunit AcrB
VRTVGYDRADNLRIAKELQQRIAAIPGVVDAHLQQEQYASDFSVDIDRAPALQFGIKASDIGNNISTTFSSSEQVQPNFWTDPKNGIPYYIAVQTPQYLISSMGDIGNTPVNTGTAPPTTQPVPGELQNVATFTRDSVPGSANEANIQPVYEVYASTQGPRSRQHRQQHRQGHHRSQERAQARQHHRGDRPDRKHEQHSQRHG